MSNAIRGVGVLVLAASASASIAPAQTPPVDKPDPVTAQGRILREIKDPHTGDTWRLLPNASDPAGPGLLVRSAGIGLKMEHEIEKEKLVIHRGDRVVVEEHGAVVEAYLEATALEPALKGLPLNLRLTIGGKVIRAVAIAPGRAEVRR